MLMFTVIGCSPAAWPASEISTDATGLRTYTWVAEWDGVLAGCGDVMSEGLRGVFEGSAEDPREPVWIVTPGGRVSVVWPAGFRAAFAAGAQLYDPAGLLVAERGTPVHLMDVAPGSAQGSFEDPYVARGRVFGGCYIYRRPSQ
ncbi:MAG TPA: hypothetical protein VH741_00450 [Candidatus Limnocylindrales bacterium]